MENPRISSQSETIPLGDAGPYTIGTFHLQTEGTGWTGSIVIKARLAGSGLTYQNWPYRNELTDVAVAAGTPITADGLWSVKGDGVEIELVHDYAAGSVAIGARVMGG